MSPDAFSNRLAISVTRPDGVVVVRAEGDVDLDNADQLTAALRSADAEQDDAVVLDLTGVPFMDSSGLKVLLVALGELGERLTLAVGPGSPVETLLDLAEVRDRFSIHPTPEAAVRSRTEDS